MHIYVDGCIVNTERSIPDSPWCVRERCFQSSKNFVSGFPAQIMRLSIAWMGERSVEMVVNVGAIWWREGPREGSSTIFSTERPQVRSSCTETMVTTSTRGTPVVLRILNFTITRGYFAAAVYDSGSDWAGSECTVCVELGVVMSVNLCTTWGEKTLQLMYM